jgi:GTP-binding protein
MPELLARIAKMMDEIPLEQERSPAHPVHVKLEAAFWVEKNLDELVVKGKNVERLIAMTNFSLPEGVERTQRILRKMGVERELLSHGAKSGDMVKIGTIEFTFSPEIGSNDLGFHGVGPRRSRK